MRSLFGLPKRSFGAMGQVNKDLFEHTFTTQMKFQSHVEKIPCFRVMDESGKIINTGGYEKMIPQEKLIKMFETMVTMNEADKVFNAAQRQGRISFYMTQTGEEASNIGTAAAIEDHDIMFPQYRESGAFHWRGFSIAQMAH